MHMLHVIADRCCRWCRNAEANTVPLQAEAAGISALAALGEAAPPLLVSEPPAAPAYSIVLS